MAEVSLFLQLAGIVVEIFGVLMMANGLAGISRPTSLPTLLLRALWARPTVEARLSQALDGDRLDEELKYLRERHFAHEAATIEAEEARGFRRFERPRVYGRN